MKRRTLKSLLGLICALSTGIALNAAASAKNLYISPSGSGTDGSSWSSAWQDPAKIDWSKVQAGDQIILDGGTSGITYVTEFTVPASNVVIRQATDKEHSGQVTLKGINPTRNLNSIGINVLGSNVHIVAARRSGIVLKNYPALAVSLKTNGNSLRNVEINGITGFQPYGTGKIGGVAFGGFNNQFINCDFRDCVYGAVEKTVAGARNLTVFNNCTFGSNRYGYWGEDGSCIVGAKTATGAPSIIYAHHCVFGPFVNYGIDQGNNHLLISDSLFLNARIANLNVTSNAPASVRAFGCTFYQKQITDGNIVPKAVGGLTQNTIATSGTADVKVSNSIIYGGVVKVPATQVLNAGNNIQYAVSGNTVALAAQMTDPNFVDKDTLQAPGTVATFVPQTLTTLNFDPAIGSPASGKGSSFDRVSDSVAAYGPIYGIPTAIGGP